ncbi:hypothetical protein ACOSQ3_015035 [Xanthoceras sorbifolium]
MSNWSNLPINILNSIVESVWKSWRSNIYDDVKYADKLPCIMGYSSCEEILSDRSFYLYEPSQKRRYGLKSRFLIGKRLPTSKFGWLLLSNKGKFFNFYSPFTSEINYLPELHMKDTYNTATFSTAPTSSNCVMIVVISPYYQGDNKFCVSTWSLGDTIWNSCWFNIYYEKWIEKIVYARGVFYCAFDQLFTYIDYQLFTPYRLYLIKSPDDGNLLLSYYHRNNCPDCIFRFDQSQMKWFSIENFMSNCWYNEHQHIENETLNNSIILEASKLVDTVHWFSSKKCTTSSEGKGQPCPQIYDWVDRRGLRE